MDNQFVDEAALDGIDVSAFHEVWLARASDQAVGECVRGDRRLAQFVDRNKPAPTTVTRRLFVLVEEPTDAAAVARVRDKLRK